MRVLFVAYCMINNENGDSLIGVYKRSLRIGMELSRRGHEVWIFCTGRQQYRDALTAAADERLRFLDLPAEVLLSDSIELRRRHYASVFGPLKPDIVVAGEAPLAGTILEATLCAVGLGVPVVMLDNAYSPGLARLLVEAHGPMMDGVVLTGPASFHMTNAPPYYCSAPPYISGTTDAAQALLEELGLARARLMTVLGYEQKAEQLAVSLLPVLSCFGCVAVILCADPPACWERLRGLSDRLKRRIRVLPPPDEDLLFGLLALSQLVVGKCGFMQVSECLAVGTPFIGVEYRGCFSPRMLDLAAQRFVHATARVAASAGTILAALRFLYSSKRSVRRLHDGRFGGSAVVADFLERLPPIPRPDTADQCARCGYTPDVLRRVLEQLDPGAPIRLVTTRVSLLRNTPAGRIDCLTCVYETGAHRRQAFLWGRVYRTAHEATTDLAAATADGSPRRILYRSADGRAAIELDIGEPALPQMDF